MKFCSLYSRIIVQDKDYRWYGFWIINKTKNHNTKDDIIVYDRFNRLVKTSNNHVIEKIINEFDI